MYYLLDNANRVRQYGSTRRKTRHGGIPTGAIILHCVQGISDLSGPVGSIDARGVDGGCFEGRMIFTGNPNYVAPYRICP